MGEREEVEALAAELSAVDPYDRPVFIQGHSHAEPVCAWPDCETYLTRDEMRALRTEGDADD